MLMMLSMVHQQSTVIGCFVSQFFPQLKMLKSYLMVIKPVDLCGADTERGRSSDNRESAAAAAAAVIVLQ